MQNEKVIFKICELEAGRRLDQVMVNHFSEYSRSHLQKWIAAGFVRKNKEIVRKKEKVWENDVIEVEVQDRVVQTDNAENIAMNIVFEDAQIMVLNKPAGLVVHPGAGNRSGTLLNGLLAHDPGLRLIPRAGIVHRLDKETSGLLVIAKTLEAHKSLLLQLKEHTVKREYDALIFGHIISGGCINLAMGRDKHNRLKMSVCRDGKAAITHYRVQKKFQNFSWLKVNLETGRTHQIRVHLAAIKYPIVGDPLYTSRRKYSKAMPVELKEVLDNFTRQALHASRLSFTHPVKGNWVEFSCGLPEDMENLLMVLNE